MHYAVIPPENKYQRLKKQGSL